MRKFSSLLLAVLLLASLAGPSAALDLGKVLGGKKINVKEVLKDAAKVAGVGILVDKLAKPLNDFINQLLLTHGAGNRETTKVVPILTVGREGHIGAAQVCGPEELVKKVRAVIQFEDDFNVFDRSLRVRALVPNATVNPLKIERVYGVGVTAIMDLPL